MVPTDLNAVVDSYLDSPGFTKLAETRSNVAVTTSIDRSIGRILGSSPHLSKVIMNLVVNAFDAMPDGGRLTISTSQQHLDRLPSGFDKIVAGPYVIVSVADSGTGIDPADIEKIFEPYFSKKTMGTSGSGLGLSVVYGVVKDHKGYYDIISELGRGTTFVFYFPVSAVTADTRPQNVVELKGTEAVLVVDDDTGQREMTSELLSSLGYRVSTVCNGHEALQFLAEHSVDIVLLDMIMEPGFDGLDTYREIHQMRPLQKVVIISGFSPTERVQEMQNLGAGQYVRKPFTRQALAAAIRAELARTSEVVPTNVLDAKPS
jgi:CheY-like chemotaxis protein